MFWIDEVGTALETEGVAPGRIFEFSPKLGNGFLPGGVVVTKESIQEGQVPLHPNLIDRVIVRRQDGVRVTLSGDDTAVTTGFYRIFRHLC